MTGAKKAAKIRLDLLVVQQGLAPTREQARRLIMAGQVTVANRRADKPGQLVPADAPLAVLGGPRYVSRGGLKLEAALDTFALAVTGSIAVDVGASTGGFTDCLLQRGAARVYAIDVGYGQLAWKLQTDPRVVVLDRTNVRHLAALPDGVTGDMAVIDASFISLALVLPATLRLVRSEAPIVALVKPQFEAGRADVGKGGVVRAEPIHRRVLTEVVALAQTLGLAVAGLMASPLLGPAGNVEFLVYLQGPAGAVADPGGATVQLIEQALREAGAVRRQDKPGPV